MSPNSKGMWLHTKDTSADGVLIACSSTESCAAIHTSTSVLPAACQQPTRVLGDICGHSGL
jgi:hypothetical protein